MCQLYGRRHVKEGRITTKDVEYFNPNTVPYPPSEALQQCTSASPRTRLCTAFKGKQTILTPRRAEGKARKPEWHKRCNVIQLVITLYKINPPCRVGIYRTANKKIQQPLSAQGKVIHATQVLGLQRQATVQDLQFVWEKKSILPPSCGRHSSNSDDNCNALYMSASRRIAA